MTIDTLWILLCSVCVFLMIPGMGFFYAGLSRSQHSLSTALMSIVTIGPCALLWFLVGDSLIFSKSIFGFIGNLDNAVFLKSNKSITDCLESIFQMFFSLLSVAIISGAVIERIKFRFWILFGPLWLLFVYYPIAHWVWAKEGWLNSYGAMDFAGGIVIHVSTGASALIFSKMLGRRLDFFKLKKSYNPGLTILGTFMLSMGWFGFNAGSSSGFDEIALVAFVNTVFAIIAGVFTWIIIDYTFTPHKVYTKGVCISVICSLVGITPAAGYVSIYSALLIGALTCLVCNIGIKYFHSISKIDDSCDVFVSHCMGGIVGAILTGLLSSADINKEITINNNILSANLISCLVVIIYSIFITKLIVIVLSKYITLRVTEREENIGADISQHGESVIVISPNGASFEN